ncbi:MAG: glutamate--cysteine ligase, partial [Gammaproteobacteria bacterium]|nr:glutamate--cysteine ligase [Gammaproteobacteria bacterium]
MNYDTLERRLRKLSDLASLSLTDSLIGLEKESLRVSQHGTIAKTPHPPSLGAALTHPYITTDYSEALLELITPPRHGVSSAVDYLHDLHTFIYANIKDEIIWSTSMPCVVEGEAGIPIAYYGESNIGKMKTIYRRGLGYRYGKIMQVIAGIHFNFSLPEAFWPLYQGVEQTDEEAQAFINRTYFGQIRNLQRYGWLI